jgi:hypothetical protein
MVKKGRGERLNAASYYEKVANLYKSFPSEMNFKTLITCWPTELTEPQMVVIKKWISSNSQALSQLELGSRKPYFCTQYHEKYIIKIMPPYLMEMKRLAQVILCCAKIKALNNDITGAVEDIFITYRLA